MKQKTIRPERPETERRIDVCRRVGVRRHIGVRCRVGAYRRVAVCRRVAVACLTVLLLLSLSVPQKSRGLCADVSLMAPEYRQPDTVRKLVGENRENILVLCTDGSGALYDTIFIVSITPKRDAVRVISLPRDLYVPYSQEICDRLTACGLFHTKGIFKLNAAGTVGHMIGYPASRFDSDAISFMADVLEQMTGVSVSDYAMVSFDAFSHIIDAIGGVTVTVACDIRGADGRLLLAQGTQTLSGAQALLYARTRIFYDENGDKIPADGDFTRKEHQLAMIREILPQLEKAAVLTRLPQLIRILNRDVHHSFTLKELYQYGRFAQSVGDGSISLDTVVIRGPAIDPLHDGCAYLAFQ